MEYQTEALNVFIDALNINCSQGKFISNVVIKDAMPSFKALKKVTITLYYHYKKNNIKVLEHTFNTTMTDVTKEKVINTIISQFISMILVDVSILETTKYINNGRS